MAAGVVTFPTAKWCVSAGVLADPPSSRARDPWTGPRCVAVAGAFLGLVLAIGTSGAAAQSDEEYEKIPAVHRALGFGRRRARWPGQGQLRRPHG